MNYKRLLHVTFCSNASRIGLGGAVGFAAIVLLALRRKGRSDCRSSNPSCLATASRESWKVIFFKDLEAFYKAHKDA